MSRENTLADIRRKLEPWLERRFLWLLVLTSLIEVYAYRQNVSVAGGASAPLDDVLIHFEYARSIAEGHPFRYGDPAAPASSGATSILYAYALAVPYALGLRGFSLLFASHAYGALGWAAAAEGMARIGESLWSRSLGACAALVCVWHGGYAWSGASGMETILAVATLTWLVALSLKVAVGGDGRPANALAVLGLVAPLVRPELAAVSGLAAFVLLVALRGKRRWLAVVPLSALGVVPAFWWIVTGTARSTGALSKWAPYDPYETRSELVAHVVEAVRYQVFVVLGGTEWAERYYPRYTWVLSGLGYVLVLARALRARRFLVALVVLSTLGFLLLPATFEHYFVHRYRYLWAVLAVPTLLSFVPLLAVGARTSGRLDSDPADDRRDALALLGAGVLLGLYATRAPAALDDLAQCTREIREQQIRGALELVRPLPRGAIVLMNDAGASAYLGGHPTLDLVGLTSMPLAGLQAQGAGSVIEGLERLPREQQPTHAWVYRHWLRADDLLGRRLGATHAQTSSILGGTVMDLSEFRRDLLGSGEAPFTPIVGGARVVDALDVADVVSERAHEHDVEGDVRDDDLERVYQVDGRAIADGGRVVRSSERFRLRARERKTATLLLRTDAYFAVRLRVIWNGRPLPLVDVPMSRRFVEIPIPVPAEQVEARNDVRVERHDGGPNYAAFHYYLVQP